MKKCFLLLSVISMMIGFAACKKGQDSNLSNNKDSLMLRDSLKLVEVLDTTYWGHMGDGTAMSMLEFVTDNGDTLYLRRSNEETGEQGQMLGTIRNSTDRFAVIIGNRQDAEAMYADVCINASELMGMWKNKDTKIALYVDGAADNETYHYTKWQLINGKLVLSGKTSTEYGETDRIDTMLITYLDEDSLMFTTPQHNEIRLGR